GALGIEALSRGAREAVFIESHPAACRAILDSLARTGFADKGKVLRGKVPAGLKAAGDAFDLVFVDPPYDDETASETLSALHQLLAPGARVVFEHRNRYNPPEHPAGLRLDE